MAFTMVTLTAPSGYRRADGTVPNTRIRATPYVEMVNGTRTVNQEVTVPLNSAGTGLVAIAATTDPGTTPAGNVYSLVVEADGYPVRQLLAAIPHNAGSTVSIDSLTALTAAPNLNASYSLVVLTQAAYNALSSPDAHTLYVVIG